jgi:SAM-dependent MidA family methyltransferase
VAAIVPDTLSPLETEIRRLIRIAGPMPVSKYVELCLTHPQHGYYVTRDPLGRAGDFTTAPEISQIFGELVGLWAASVWQMMGSPNRICLVELGPGRGTMMADILRAAKILPDFDAALSVHLVETSPALRELQRVKLDGTGKSISWDNTLDNVPKIPSIYFANEFFDALPVRQAVKQGSNWHERTVEVSADNKLQFSFHPAPLAAFEETVPFVSRNAPDGTIFEWRSPYSALELGRRVSRSGAALVIDYGHLHSGVGDTLQAVRAHKFADPLASPGLADLSSHVDFEALAAAIAGMGARTEKTIDQGTFLKRLGIATRASALKAGTDKAGAAAIDSAVERLTATRTTGMGRLFKVLGAAQSDLPTLPGFDG